MHDLPDLNMYSSSKKGNDYGLIVQFFASPFLLVMGALKNDPLPLGPGREHSVVQQGSPSASLQQHPFMSCGTSHLHVSPIVGPT